MKAKEYTITNTTSIEVFDDILRDIDQHIDFEITVSVLSDDMMDKVAALTDSININVPLKNSSVVYDTVYGLTLRGVDHIILQYTFAKHTKRLVYSLIDDIVSNYRLFEAWLYFSIDEQSIVSDSEWDQLIAFCIDHKIQIGFTQDSFKHYNRYEKNLK